MGKLHTLRRAIELNPYKWKSLFVGADFYHNQWHPSYYTRSYRSFIRSVLGSLWGKVGNADDGAR